MKIYRYQFRKGRIIVDDFECNLDLGYYRMIGSHKQINPIDFNKLRYNNYIMWSLESDKENYFLDLILSKKKEIYEGHISRTNTVKLEIEMIERLKLNL